MGWLVLPSTPCWLRTHAYGLTFGASVSAKRARLAVHLGVLGMELQIRGVNGR